MKKGSSGLTVEEYSHLADFFKIFGDGTRLRILVSLQEGEQSVNSIADKIEMNQSAVSHQLRILKHSGLVRSRREGKRTFYSLDDHHIELILKLGIEHKQEG